MTHAAKKALAELEEQRDKAAADAATFKEQYLVAEDGERATRWVQYQRADAEAHVLAGCVAALKYDFEDAEREAAENPYDVLVGV